MKMNMLKRTLGFVAIIGMLSGVDPLSGYTPLRDLKSSGIVYIKWPSAGGITYRINTTVGANVTGARTLGQVFSASFGAWDALTTADISFVQGANTDGSTTYSGSNPDFVNLLKTNISDADFLAIAGDALGVTINAYTDNGAIVDSDILFNPGVLFSTEVDTPTTRTDLQSVATHEIGHLLGLDHSSILSATMFPSIGEGLNYARVLSTDEVAGIGALYPTAEYLSRGAISGTVRLTSNSAVYGALVVAVNAEGQPVASTITDPGGYYFIGGLPAGTYTVLAEPMDRPFTFNNVGLSQVFPGKVPVTNFTTRFR